jgi:hypothetical protein
VSPRGPADVRLVAEALVHQGNEPTIAPAAKRSPVEADGCHRLVAAKRSPTSGRQHGPASSTKVIQNARSPLDHLISHLVICQGKTPTRTNTWSIVTDLASGDRLLSPASGRAGQANRPGSALQPDATQPTSPRRCSKACRTRISTRLFTRPLPYRGHGGGCQRRPIGAVAAGQVQLSSPRVRPPSTSSVTPVIYAASLEQRKAAAAAISSGDPNRRSGMVSASRVRAASGSGSVE